MRHILASVLAASLAASSGSASVLVARPAVAAEPTPEQLYEEGRKAYRLGRYTAAVEKWEQAYAASDNALILYNIGLAYKGWYGVSKDIEHLRRARAVFQNFLIEAQRDPDRFGDPGEVEQQIKEVDEMLVKAEEEARTAQPGTDSPETDPAQPSPTTAEKTPPLTQTPVGTDPGKKMRVTGISLLAAGSALTVGGVIMGVLMGLKGIAYFEEQQDNNALKQECEGPNPPTDMAGIDRCNNIDNAIKTTDHNGNLANIYTGLGYGLIGGLGVVGVATGAVLFAVGSKKTRAWKTASSIRVVPSLRGIAIVGRF